MRNFYGECHGKSAADGIIGRLKMDISTAVKIGTLIEDPEKLYNYCKKELQTPLEKGCQHFRKDFLYFPEIFRPDIEEEVDTVEFITKQHCIRTTGKKGVLEMRELSCFCGCLQGKPCKNKSLVMPWKIMYFKDTTYSKNSHWKPSRLPSKKSSVTQKPQAVTQQPQAVCSSHSSCSSHTCVTPQTWDTVGPNLVVCRSYHQLSMEVGKIGLPTKIEHRIQPFDLSNVHVDEISVGLFPPDAPGNTTPISVYGDVTVLPDV